jgi:RHS repeat-associated protein
MRKGIAVFARLFASAVLMAAVTVRAGDTVTYYYNDAQGSPVVAADAQGNVIERTDYAPYGATLNRPVHDGPGYTGHEEDSATGLTYMQQRYYDTQSGQFISTDPVLPDGYTGASFNRYAYANGNPYRFADPDGRDITEALGGVFYETASFVTGNGFHGSQIAGALADGYNGQGGGVGHALVEDASTISAAAGIAGVIKGGAALLTRSAAKEIVEEGANLAKGGSKSLKEQAAELVEQNGGKNRVTLRSPSQKVEIDLTGKSHGGVETPHTKISQRNLDAPNQPAYNTKSAEVKPATQDDMRMARKYLEKEH